LPEVNVQVHATVPGTVLLIQRRRLPVAVCTENPVVDYVTESPNVSAMIALLCFFLALASKSILLVVKTLAATGPCQTRAHRDGSEGDVIGIS
jgi:hypothetical protein